MSIPVQMKRYFEKQYEYKQWYDYYEPLVSDEDDRFKWIAMAICEKHPNKAKYLNPAIFEEINMCRFNYKTPKKFVSYSNDVLTKH